MARERTKILSGICSLSRIVHSELIVLLCAFTLTRDFTVTDYTSSGPLERKLLEVRDHVNSFVCNWHPL